METTPDTLEARRVERWRAASDREDELASLSAHLSAATARWLELVAEMREEGDSDDLAGFLAWRCGITRREAHEYVRVADALRELPVVRAAFGRGELTYTKVRALTRVATGASEQRLLELAGALTASQLERALRTFRRLASVDARRTHELELVSYRFEEDGSLYLRARLAAEDGVLVVKALDAARERVVQRRREERAAADAEPGGAPVALPVEPARPVAVEALLELADTALALPEGDRVERARIVVHVDADALTTDGRGRSELEDGPVVATETARRLGCDSDLVARVERDGLPVSVGRSRRTVPPALRRLLEARDEHTCCFPGCDRQRHLQAHHRHHWAHGGETSLDNLVLLCRHHHRLVHEGGYAVEESPGGGIRFRNRHGLLTATSPPRPPPGSADGLRDGNRRRGPEIGPRTNRNGGGERLDLTLALAAISDAVAGSRLAA